MISLKHTVDTVCFNIHLESWSFCLSFPLLGPLAKRLATPSLDSRAEHVQHGHVIYVWHSYTSALHMRKAVFKS